MLRSTFFVVAVFALFCTIHYFSLPDPLSKLDVPYKFRIYRDDYGIPKIVAKDLESSYFARGFAEAQDRLWTLFIKKNII